MVTLGDTEETPDFRVKVIMLGDAGVGKSMLLSRYTRGEFKLGCKATVGVEFGQKTVCIAGDTVGAQIWDTCRAHVYAWLAVWSCVCGCSMCFSAQRGHMDVVVAAGQERFASLARKYFRDAVGALLAFDMTSRKSFESVGRWVKRAHSLASQHIVVLLVANKSDLAHRRKVSTEEAVALAQAYNMAYIETSALDTTNVDTAFERVLAEIHRLETRHRRHPSPPSSPPDAVGHGENGAAAASIPAGDAIRLPKQEDEGDKPHRSSCCS